jgi:starch phosphorylase
MLPIEIPAAPSLPMRLPRGLDGLRRLAYNLYWTWHPEVRSLFSRVDPTAWARSRSPIPVLHGMHDWSRLLEDADFLAEYQTQLGAFDTYMANGAGHWFARRHSAEIGGPVAYFCAEYGLHESLAVYSGGLGILAGDHCKTASDMALPFIGVGLLYRHGYFRQAIDADGHQEHAYPDYEPGHLPILRVTGPDGEPLEVSVELPGRAIRAAVWLAQVGRVPLLLLDTDVPDNEPEDRPITHQLYVRGREMRLHQEIVLGVGGVRALRALGVRPSVWHLNEGHSAFMLVERARELTVAGEPEEAAFEAIRRDAVFTIHTPVSAGNERFDAALVRGLSERLLDGSGLSIGRVLELGRGADDDPAVFDMTAFSLRLTHAANAVSQLHMQTANATWQGTTRSAILGITNGIHAPSWVGGPVRSLYQALGADLDALSDESPAGRFWERLEEMPDRELWEAHRRQKLALAIFARGRLLRQFARHGEAPETLEALSGALDPSVLTIGFARRFATYKRAALLLSQEDRLARLLSDPGRPVQVVFAGKAHPADRPGQRVIQEIFERTRSPRLRGRIFFLEDYDMRIARHLVQGVDVWLNNPRRPLEASGTSGMKAAANGAVNCSVLDGWWDEGWTGTNGWAIGGRETLADETAQDWADAQDLYRLLEEEIVPRWYERDAAGLPRAWIALMKASMASTLWRFSTTRMLEQYVERLYLPAAEAGDEGSAPRPVLAAEGV